MPLLNNVVIFLFRCSDLASESPLSLIMVSFLHVPTSIGASPGFWGFTLFFACPRLEIRNFLKEFPPPISVWVFFFFPQEIIYVWQSRSVHELCLLLLMSWLRDYFNRARKKRDIFQKMNSYECLWWSSSVDTKSIVWEVAETECARGLKLSPLKLLVYWA